MSIPGLSYKHQSEDLQDLNARTSWGGCRQDLLKVFAQGPVRDHERSPRGFHQDLFKSFSQGPAQDHAKASDSMALGFPQELRSFAQGFAKDLDQGLHARTPKRSSHELHKRTCCCWSGSCKILPPRASHKRAFTQAPVRHGICKIVMQGPLSLREGLTRISTRSSVKDLYRIMQGPLREEFSRISTKGPSMREFTMTMPRTKSLRTPPRKLCASSRSRNAQWTCHESHFIREFTGKMPRPKIGPCSLASLRSQTTHGHVTRATLRQNLQAKCCAPELTPTFWANLRSRNAHGHLTRATLCENLQKNAARQMEHPDVPPALTPRPTVEALSVDTLFGEKNLGNYASIGSR